MSEIDRYRGDTAPDKFTITDSDTKLAIDISGFSFAMTVNSEKEPTDTGNQIFSLVGNITNAAEGLVQFEPSAINADQTPNVYFYDVQMIDASGFIETLVKDKYNFKQDITK